MKILWKFQEKWRKLTWTSTLPSWREVCVQNSPCLRGWARAHLRTNPSQLAYWGWAWECFLSKAEPYTIDMSRNYAWRLHVFSIPGFGIGVLWASSCQFSNDFSEILVITLVLCMRRMRATEAIGSLQMTKGVGQSQSWGLRRAFLDLRAVISLLLQQCVWELPPVLQIWGKLSGLREVFYIFSIQDTQNHNGNSERKISISAKPGEP